MAKAKTKLERATAIVRKFPNKVRGEMVEKLIEQLGMTPAGASTYFYKAHATVAAEERAAKRAARKAA